MTRRILALGTSAILAAGLVTCTGGGNAPTSPTGVDPATTAGPTASSPTTETPTADATTPEPTTAEPTTPAPTTSSPTDDGPWTPAGESAQSGDWMTVAGGDLFLASLGADDDSVTAVFDGAGPLSWEARYVDTAYTQGKGDPVVIDGAGAYLQVTVAGLRYPEPSETVITDASGDDITVKVDPPFEGMSVLVIGVEEAVPYRVEVTDNPVTLRVTLDD